jgi:hypothetical protein
MTIADEIMYDVCPKPDRTKDELAALILGRDTAYLTRGLHHPACFATPLLSSASISFSP